MANPVLYGPTYSTYTRTVRLALAEKGVDYDLVDVNFITGGMPEDHLARQPFGKVPAFEHDGLLLYETSAITRYVDEAFEGPALQPDSAAERARMGQVISIVDSYGYGAIVVRLVIQRLVQPMLGGVADEEMIAGALPEVDRTLGALESMIGSNEYFAGGAPSLADLHLAPVFAYFTGTPEGTDLLGSRPGLQAWWKRVGRRRSMRDTEPQFG